MTDLLFIKLLIPIMLSCRSVLYYIFLTELFFVLELIPNCMNLHEYFIKIKNAGMKEVCKIEFILWFSLSPSLSLSLTHTLSLSLSLFFFFWCVCVCVWLFIIFFFFVLFFVLGVLIHSCDKLLVFIIVLIFLGRCQINYVPTFQRFRGLQYILIERFEWMSIINCLASWEVQYKIWMNQHN